jgi:hypothetical protein
VGLLPNETVVEIRNVAVDEGLAAKREALFFQIAAKDQLTVPALNQADQLTRDVQELNKLDELTADGYLLAIWLRNAAYETQLKQTVSRRFEAWRDEILARPATLSAVPNVGSIGPRLQWQRADLEALAFDANDLMLSKRLHDRLHMAQQLLPPFRTVVNMGGIDPALWKSIARSQVKPFSDIALGMAGELGDLPPDNDLARLGAAMVAQFQACIAAVDATLDQGLGASKPAMAALRNEIKRQMEEMAIRVEVDVKALRLNVLITKLRDLAGAAKGTPLAGSYDDAIKALTIIYQDLSSLGPQHRAWQNLDSLLWLTEDFFEHLAEADFIRASFEANWKQLGQMLEALAGDPREPWYTNNDAIAQKFMAACPMPVAVPVSPDAAEQFQNFLNVTRQVFYGVDVKLKTSCNRLGAITRQLAAL